MTRPQALLLVALAPLLGAASCPATKSACDRKQSDIHYDLGIESQKNGDVRGAVREFEESVRLCSDNHLAETGLGILLHNSFRRMDEAELHYKRALEIKPGYSEAKVNLGNLYLDLGKYDEAIKLYEESLKDMFYQKPYLPLNNEGWCWYKKGDTEKAVGLIQEAVRINPDFCQGYRNLALINFELTKYDLARVEIDKVTKKCPEVAEGWYRTGLIELKQGDEPGARASFQKCRDLSKEGEPLLEECAKLGGSGK